RRCTVDVFGADLTRLLAGRSLKHAAALDGVGDAALAEPRLVRRRARRVQASAAGAGVVVDAAGRERSVERAALRAVAAQPRRLTTRTIDVAELREELGGRARPAPGADARAGAGSTAARHRDAHS